MAERIVTRHPNYCKSTSKLSTCAHCEAEFVSKRAGNIYCSRRCSYTVWNRKMMAPRKEVPCKFCSKPVLQRTVWQAFCGRKCRDQWRRNPTARTGIKNCLVCNSEFTPTVTFNQMYCSEKCRKVGYSKVVSKYRSKNKSKSLCTNCSRQKMETSAYLCETHWFRKIAKSNGIVNGGDAVKKLIEDQNYICPYTGKRLVLGLNASIDHKNPRSRFPDTWNRIENIEWVDIYVNSAKREMTKEEFISFCKLVSSRFPG
jgi:hypothetical protein